MGSGFKSFEFLEIEVRDYTVYGDDSRGVPVKSVIFSRNFIVCDVDYEISGLGLGLGLRV